MILILCTLRLGMLIENVLIGKVNVQERMVLFEVEVLCDSDQYLDDNLKQFVEILNTTRDRFLKEYEILKDGGFVCRNCIAEDTERDLNKTQMLLIRSAFNASDMGRLDYKCTKGDALIILNKFIEFITESYGVRLKSAKLINKM